MDVLVSSWSEIAYSFAMAFAGAFVMTVFAFFISYIMERSPSRYRSVLEYMTQLPFAIPAILLGVGLIKLWNHPVTAWLYGSSFMVINGICGPFCPLFHLGYTFLFETDQSSSGGKRINALQSGLLSALLTPRQKSGFSLTGRP